MYASARQNIINMIKDTFDMNTKINSFKYFDHL